MGREIALEFSDAAELRAELERNFGNGGCMVPGDWGMSPGDSCDVVLVAPHGERLALSARVVYGGDHEVGVPFIGFGPELKDQLVALVEAAEAAAAAPAAAPAPAPATPLPPSSKLAKAAALSAATRPNKALNPHERLRGLSIAQQLKVAREGDVNERTVLERIYGKAVWEALLMNPRLTHPEVARLARMGTLPRPQLEMIVGNQAWINNGAVRRALLANRRLTPAMAEKVLRSMPKHELKLAPKQTAYPPAVRDAARRMLQRKG